MTTTDHSTALPLARYKAARRAPYLSPLLHAIPAFATERIPTLCVSTLPTGAMLMLYNPAFLASLTPDVAATAVLHEVAHVYLHHAARIGGRDPQLHNIAADMAVHEQFQAASWPLGEGWVTAAGFNLPRNLSSDQYYDLLMSQAQSAKAKAGKGPGQGTACGSGATGSAAEGEAEAVADAVGQGYGEGQDTKTVSRARVQAARAVKEEAAKSRGSVPGDWATVADDILAALAEPEVPWDRMLRRHIQHAVRVAVGTGTQRYTVPSRRQAGLGYGPGSPVLPGHRRPVPDVTVVVDTSGSMGAADYRKVLAEMDAILQSTGGRVTLYAVDADVQSHGVIRSLRDSLKHFKGGGGTSFDPPFHAIARAGGRTDVLVYFTDGYGSVSVPKPAYPVVWVTTGAKEFPWGAVVPVGAAKQTP